MVGLFEMQPWNSRVTALFVDLEPENPGYRLKSKKSGICSRCDLIFMVPSILLFAILA